MKQSPITLDMNRLSSTVSLTREQYFFLEKFIWNKLTVPGKDMSGKTTEPTYWLSSNQEMHIETIAGKHTAADAYDAHLQFAQLVTNEISTHLKKFELQRSQWENALLMTLNACGLCDMEGGES